MITRSLAALLLMSGCGAILPGAAARLSGLSPLTADPAGMAIAVDLPEGLGLRPGSAVLGFSVTREDEVAAREFILTGGAAEGFSVAAGDLEPFREVQALAQAWKAADPEGTTGSLSLTFGPCLTGALAPEARVSARIRLEQDEPFLPLLRPQRVSEFAEALALDTIPPCGD